MSDLPSHGVYTRIQPSSRHGVGVFAIRPITSGTKIFEIDDSEIIWLDKRSIDELAPVLHKLFDDFCIVKNGRLGCPRNFNAMTPSWYLNHSGTPNVACDERFDFFAGRDIAVGEELTIDYRTYSE